MYLQFLILCRPNEGQQIVDVRPQIGPHDVNLGVYRPHNAERKKNSGGLGPFLRLVNYEAGRDAK